MGIKGARSLLITRLGKSKHELFGDNLCSISKESGLVPSPDILIRIRALFWEVEDKCPHAFRQLSE